jgi:Na+-transporting methylmalonyl-CoA/oxaloacetate decarboxylase gamma subunit
MIMVLTLVFLTEYSNLQILVYLVSAIGKLVFVTQFKPYENEAQNT